MEMLAVAIRFGSYAVLSLAVGIPLFLRLSLGPGGGGMLGHYRGPYILLLWIGAMLSGLGLLVASSGMAGAPVLPIDWEMVGLVISATAFGKALLIRSAFLVLAGLMVMTLRPIGLAVTATLAAIASTTLAWGGHAAAGEGLYGWLHLVADVAHILAASLWVGGMACLLLAFRRPSAEEVAPMLAAFAPIGGVIVLLLIGTGVVNSVMTIGLDALGGAWNTLYGRLLALKLLAFLFMLGLAANNRFRLTPLFERDPDHGVQSLRRAIALEMTLALVILLLVGWFGMIDPSQTV
jgi:putative copper resistance protein D